MYLRVISCVPLLHSFMKSQTCSGVAFLAKSTARIGPYLSTKCVQLSLSVAGRKPQTFSNAASIAAADLLF